MTQKNRFDTSNYEAERLLRKEKQKKRVICFVREKLSGKTIEDFAGLRPKMYSDKKKKKKKKKKNIKCTKKFLIKRLNLKSRQVIASDISN